jgi:LmbE family N-acetylglucosaminyl deacetylase
MKRLMTVAGAACVIGITFFAPRPVPVQAQARTISLVAADSGHVALGVALRRLNIVGTFLETAAHPDDEHNQLFAMLSLGQGMRAVDVHTTRGEGGQNEIGPELFRDIGILRTSELLSAHRLDGAEQWFVRSIDYGYSFDPKEIYATWGRDEVVRDLVRMIRTHRPDVMLTMAMQGSGGDRAHEATSVLTQEAFRAAGDPAKYPDQIKAGLRPWQAKKMYLPGGSGVIGGQRGAPEPEAAGTYATVDAGVYDPLLGRTYEVIGADARSNHKCQGMGQLSPLPGGIGGGRGFGRSPRYRLVDTTLASQKGKNESSFFDGIDTTLAGLAAFAGANAPDALKSGLAAISAQAVRAQKAFEGGDDAGTLGPVAAGLQAVRAVRAGLGSMGLGDNARFEIDFRLKTKEADYQNALLLAAGLGFEAVADDGLVVAGQPVKVSIAVANRGGWDVSVAGVSINGFASKGACEAATTKAGGVFTCSADVQVPKNAKATEPYFTDEYWGVTPPKAALSIFAPDVEFGVPFGPTPFRAVASLKVAGVDVTKDLAIQYRYAKDPFVGEKRMELNVVPAFSVKATPETAVVPSARAGAAGRPTEREILVSVTNGTKGAADAAVTLQVPAGWAVKPATAPLHFANEDEAMTAKFTLGVPAGAKTGEYGIQAVVTSGAAQGSSFRDGYQEIEYPHIERRQVIKPARTDVKVIDVKTAPNLKVGFVVGAGDQMPGAIEQLGARLSYIQADELAWGDLSKYDVIVTGVRAYLKRADLRAYNRRLIEFAERGGTVIVEYNKTEFNQAQFGPYPARVGNGRVTDEKAPVKVLVPRHPVFNFPNRIGEATWKDWVQERGLYFLGEKDARYVDLLSMEDSAPDNPGVKLGSLVDAKVGKGHWLYLGIGLWRQLPAQTEGAYQLLANLISLPKAPASKGQ